MYSISSKAQKAIYADDMEEVSKQCQTVAGQFMHLLCSSVELMVPVKEMSRTHMIWKVPQVRQ